MSGGGSNPYSGFGSLWGPGGLLGSDFAAFVNPTTPATAPAPGPSNPEPSNPGYGFVPINITPEEWIANLERNAQQAAAAAAALEASLTDPGRHSARKPFLTSQAMQRLRAEDPAAFLARVNEERAYAERPAIDAWALEQGTPALHVTTGEVLEPGVRVTDSGRLVIRMAPISGLYYLVDGGPVDPRDVPALFESDRADRRARYEEVEAFLDAEIEAEGAQWREAFEDTERQADEQRKREAIDTAAAVLGVAAAELDAEGLDPDQTVAAAEAIAAGYRPVLGAAQVEDDEARAIREERVRGLDRFTASALRARRGAA